ncbi:hypothetical protein ACIP9C_21160 [Lysinibacillus sp. NPDC093210]|uniref:hypothetical protein n=1 Tax=Lysinibacillus sp. NPDC093210 TaxID=3364133 RepID=UPI0037FBB766
MKFNKTYIDNFFNNINDYNSMAELFIIAYGELKEQSHLPDWYVELREIINWQSQSNRSGVWTYYEILNDSSAATLIGRLKAKEENEILTKYMMGINKYSDETLMVHIDKWIWENEEIIHQYLTDVLISNKDWFYQI